MARLLIHVEGQTEESFVDSVLAPHLTARGFQSVSPRIIGNARLRCRRGGIKPWQSVKLDIVHHLTHDRGCLSTTMVDYYALPKDGSAAWPGRAAAATIAVDQRAALVEEAIRNDLQPALNIADRFIPFIMIHEFEALLFSACDTFCRAIGSPHLTPQFQAIRQRFANPEEIDDSPHTAPSKRIQQLVPGYEKPLHGIIAALEIGLDRMRGECPHFNDWLTRLETLGKQTA